LTLFFVVVSLLKSIRYPEFNRRTFSG